MDHCCKPPDPRVKKSASVSDQIIEYYYKFGQNRDLEKFLRLRRNYNKSKSSSEGSLAASDPITEHWPSCSRALFSSNASCPGNLEFANNNDAQKQVEDALQSSTQENKESTEVVSNPPVDEEPIMKEVDKPSSKTEGQTVVNVSSKKEIEDDKRSYSFNCESHIAISILPPPLQTAVSMPQLHRPPLMIAEGSQTNFDEENTPIKEKMFVGGKTPDSVRKTHRRLEWDSLGDVGYDKSSSQGSISTLERSVLKEFFAERGIEINFPQTLHNIAEESPRSEKNAKNSHGAIPKAPREKWRQTMENVRKKYSSPSSSLSLNGTQQFARLPQSTPKLDQGLLNNTENKPTLELKDEVICSHIFEPDVHSKKSTDKIHPKKDDTMHEEKEVIRKDHIKSVAGFKSLNVNSSNQLTNISKLTITENNKNLLQHEYSKEKTASIISIKPLDNSEEPCTGSRAVTNIEKYSQTSFVTTKSQHIQAVLSTRSSSISSNASASICSSEKYTSFESHRDLPISKKYSQPTKSQQTSISANSSPANFIQTKTTKELSRVAEKQEKCLQVSLASTNSECSQESHNRSSIKSKSDHCKPVREINRKKYSQHSLASESKGAQANLSANSSLKSTNDAASINSPSSFEYYHNADKENVPRKILSEVNSNSNRSDKSQKSVSKADKKSSTELDLGVQLLCSLIESKNLTEKQKKVLARRIVLKITRTHNTSDLISECSTLSGSSALSIRSLIESVKNDSNVPLLHKQMPIIEEHSSSKSFGMESSALFDKPLPPTPAEVKTVAISLKPPSEELNSHTSKSTDEQETMREWLDPLTQSEKLYDKKNRVDLYATGDFNRPTVIEVGCKERKSHLNWIETEIKRLENLKSLLITDKDQVYPQIFSAYPVEMRTYDKVASTQRSKPNSYTSVEELTNSRSAISSSESSRHSSEIKSSNNSQPKDGKVGIIIEDSLEDVVNPVDNYKRSVKRETENITFYDEVHPEKSEKITKITVEEETRLPRDKYVRRSKLETPRSIGSNESVRSFARQRKHEFLQKYTKKIHSYDKPAESGHYSEPREVNVPSKTDAYTSVTSSDLCISSDMSIPIISASSSTTTTTHQYDNRCGVGVQTSDSLLKTRPIYGRELGCECNNPKRCCCPRTTMRVYQPARSQQTQVKPKAVAYVIKFQEPKTPSYASVTEQDVSEPSTRSQASFESLTLQEQLRQERPEFFARANDRQKILKKLHNLRQQRDKKIREIVENTSINSIPRKLEELPPPPTKNLRIFATKEMKAITEKKYSKLPEVVDKVERKKLEKWKRSNKILTDVFNKKLQRRVHKGKLSLEHSRTVI